MRTNYEIVKIHELSGRETDCGEATQIMPHLCVFEENFGGPWRVNSITVYPRLLFIFFFSTYPLQK